MICPYEETKTLECDNLYRARELYRQSHVATTIAAPSYFCSDKKLDCNCVPARCPRLKEFKEKKIAEQHQKQK